MDGLKKAREQGTPAQKVKINFPTPLKAFLFCAVPRETNAFGGNNIHTKRRADSGSPFCFYDRCDSGRSERPRVKKVRILWRYLQDNS